MMKLIASVYLVCSTAILMGAFRVQLAGVSYQSNVLQPTNVRLYYVTGAALALGILCSVVGFLKDRQHFVRHRIVFLLPGFFMLSALWSVNATETVWAALFFLCVTLSYVGNNYVWENVNNIGFLKHLLFAIVLVSTFVSLFVVSIGVHQFTDASQSAHFGEWRGVFSHRTPLGYLAMISCCMALFSLVHERRSAFNCLLLLMSVVCLVKAHSAGAYIALLLALVLWIMLIVFRKLGKDGSLFTLPLLLALSVLGVLALAWGPDQFLEVFGKDASLTGRVPYWKIALGTPSLNPIWGAGYQSGFKYVVFPRLQAAFPFGTIPNAQGGFVEAYIAGGILEMGCLCVLFSVLFYRFFQLAGLAIRERDLPQLAEATMFRAAVVGATVSLALVNVIIESDVFIATKSTYPLIILGLYFSSFEKAPFSDG